MDKLLGAAIAALDAIRLAARAVEEYHRWSQRYLLHEDEVLRADTYDDLVAKLNARRRELWDEGFRDWTVGVGGPAQHGGTGWIGTITLTVAEESMNERTKGAD